MARLFFGVVECWNLFQIFRFENLAAFHAMHVLDPIPPHQELSALMLTTRHGLADYHHFSHGRILVKPPSRTIRLRLTPEGGLQPARSFSSANSIGL